MADKRNVVLLRAIINGFPVMAALDGFNPPPVEKTTEDAKGGRFIGHKHVVGATMGDWSLSLSGASPEAIMSMGVGEQCEVTVMGSIEGDDASKVPVKYEMSGHVVKADQGEVKQGENKLTLTGSPYAYTHTENRKIIHDINAKTQKCIIGGEDMLAEHRRNVGM